MAPVKVTMVYSQEKITRPGSVLRRLRWTSKCVETTQASHKLPEFNESHLVFACFSFL